MTISSQTREAGPFVGNGTTTVFPFAFKVFQASDLYVVRLVTATGVQSTLVSGTDYTVSINSDQNASPGGTVTLIGGALATGYTLTLTSLISYLQPTDLTNTGGFYPSVINDALDRLTIFVQQLISSLSRALKFPLSDPTTISNQLPGAAARANKALVFGSDGSVGVSVDNYVNQVATVAASASAAATSASSASTSAASALTYLNNFKGQYYGPLASNPSLDPLGNAMGAGDLYWNTTIPEMRVYNGSAWVAAYVPLSSTLLAANNLSDVANAATARANIGAASTGKAIAAAIVFGG